ncbi:hypothetical protein DEM28_28375, partial [Enterobacter mori]
MIKIMNIDIKGGVMMHYKKYYESPIGQLAMTSDGKNITGLWLPNHEDFELKFNEKLFEADLI